MASTLSVILILLFILLAAGVWIAFSLLATAGISLAVFTSLPVSKIWAQALWNSLNSWALAALPMFIFLGEIVMRTKMSELLFEGLKPWVQFIPGRLLHTNIIGCTIFAAVSGSSPATAATIGKITISQLDGAGYDKSLSYGSLAGAGTLGLLIPPSIVMIIYGVLAEVSIGKLFMAGIVPGLILALCYSFYLIVRVLINPKLAPRTTETFSWHRRATAVVQLLPVAALIFLILGSIYSGLATPTEAAAVGVLVSLCLAWLLGDLRWHSLVAAMKGTIKTSTMICFIIVGASFLSVAMGYLHLPADVVKAIAALQISPYVLILFLTIFYVFLGCLLDGISMIVMTLPIALPLVVHAGFDPLWFGIYLVIVIEVAQITPPVGFNLFVIQALTDKSLGWVTLAALPFATIMLIIMAFLTAFPGIVHWLPSRM